MTKLANGRHSRLQQEKAFSGQNLSKSLGQRIDLISQNVFPILYRASKPALFVIGFVFGFSVSIGLGFELPYSLAVGFIAGFGVVVTGSLVAYLVLQFLFFAGLAFVAYLLFRFYPGIQIPAEAVQVIYGISSAFSPLLALFIPIKRALSRLTLPFVTQLTSVAFFALLTSFLRTTRPSDGVYALSQMYSGEDNAGIVTVLSRSLDLGFGAHASLFGEFFNGLYLTSAGALHLFGDASDSGMVAPLVHWNMMLLFMAWAPISAIFTLSLSGLKMSSAMSVVVIFVMTSLVGLMFWSFVGLGHTSVISTGMLFMTMLGLTLNRKLSTDHPHLFFLLIAAIGFVVGTTWFPLMPLVVSIVAITSLAILTSEFRKGNKKFLISVTVISSVIGIAVFPQVAYLFSESQNFLQLFGGTRSPTDLMVLVWLIMASMAILIPAKAPAEKEIIGPVLFALALLGTLASSAYLYAQGILGNSGAPGYGATKYLLTAISLSLPVLWLVLTATRKNTNPLTALATGAILIFAVFIVQPDTRGTVTQFFAPNQEIDVQSAKSGVYSALNSALDMGAEQIFCASDYGFPFPGGELSFDAYLCTRWGQALVGDENGGEWRFVPLDRSSVESLEPVREMFADKKVVIVRFTDPTRPIIVSDTWWSDYVEESWEIVTVR